MFVLRYLLCSSNLRIIIPRKVFWGATWPLRTGMILTIFSCSSEENLLKVIAASERRLFVRSLRFQRAFVGVNSDTAVVVITRVSEPWLNSSNPTPTGIGDEEESGVLRMQEHRCPQTGEVLCGAEGEWKTVLWSASRGFDWAPSHRADTKLTPARSQPQRRSFRRWHVKGVELWRSWLWSVKKAAEAWIYETNECKVWSRLHNRCVQYSVLVHYSMTCCSVNGASSVFTLTIPQIKKHFKNPDDAPKKRRMLSTSCTQLYQL